MGTVQPDLQNHNDLVYPIETQVIQKQGRQVERTPIFDVTGLPTYVQRKFPDPKALRMFEVYTQNKPGNTWENQRIRRVILRWLIYGHIYKNGKRAFNLLIALVGLPVFLPVMLFAAIAIRLESPGPIIFRQERVGKWGHRFTCYKFRSMYIDAEARKADLMALNEADEVVFKIKNDPRVTRVGRVIRKLSIDEIPQVFNVIKGEMNIVGPRPPVPVELESYPFDTFRRLDAVPGITGLQQVSGRSDIPFKKWVELDIEYIHHRIPFLGIKFNHNINIAF